MFSFYFSCALQSTHSPLSTLHFPTLHFPLSHFPLSTSPLSTLMSLPADLLSELNRHFRGEILTDTASRILYSTDASIYQMMPLGVAVPKSQEDLICAIELAAKYHIPVLARGAGSSLAGQAIGPALILDTSRYLNRILDINPESASAQVEPGVILASLNRAAAQYGLQYGPDPASAERATLGGVIANNATGAHSILYGMSADHILAAEVILSDGSLTTFAETSSSVGPRPKSEVEARLLEAVSNIRNHHQDEIRARWPQSWRNSAGYRLNYLLPWSPSQPPQWNSPPYPAAQPATFNLATLLAGSEGTLAVIRAATVRLVHKPSHTILGVLSYASIAAACDDVPRLLSFQPSAVELVPQMLINLARAVPAYASQLDWVQGNPAALLVVEFSGESPEGLLKSVERLGPQAHIAQSRTDQAKVWNVRKVGLGLFDSGPGPNRPVAFIEDCAIPVENLGHFVRELDKILVAHHTTAAYYAHASAGTLHIRPLLDLRTGAGVRALRTISEATLALTLRLGGAMSSEHGDGVLRAEFLEATYGASLVEAMRSLKRAADPHNLLNPGKILDAPPMDTQLRYGSEYRSQAWPTSLNFATQGGLTGAIEQCNGAGVCRKQDGVMCPSFQATGLEMFSTRGRANLMRALISSQPETPPAADLKLALDLCLACKGCKSECPSGVDVAKLKYAYLEHYYRRHPRPLRDYLFGHIGAVGAIVAKLHLGKLANVLAAAPLLRKIIDPLLQIDEKRPLPRFGTSRPRSLQLLAASGADSPEPVPHETVLFLPDAFTRHFEPEIESAALSLLQAAGIRLIEIPVLGAARPLISKGFLPAAQRHLLALLNAIQRLDPTGVLPILGLEPSELYTLKDELRDLVPAERRPEAIAVARRAFLVDEFFIRNAPDAHDKRVANMLTSLISSSAPADGAELAGSPVLLHGHCYQKAQPPAPDGFPVGQAATAEFLRAFGYEVQIIASGCCGMAGAFGYEKEHYPVSLAVGELALFPAVRKACLESPFVTISAAGASCRAQIADGAEAVAQHPLVLAVAALRKMG